MQCKLIPFSKLLAFIFLFAFFLMADSFVEAVIIALTIVFLARAYKVSLKDALAPLFGLYVFYLTVFLFNALFQPGETVYWHWWIFTLTKEGMITGLEVVLRVFIVSVLANIMTMSMSPLELSDAFRILFSPLRFLHVPVDEASFIMSLSFSFIPGLRSDAEGVMKAMKARGVSGKLKLSRMVLPLSIAAFRRADDMSNALISRGYDGGLKRKKEKIVMGRYDLLLIILSILLFIKGVI